ncbi:hypothetical protein HanPI659440_Chr13g0495181 [Helianthus annuus]|nr:hypothetical protein HanPI659440_Chr13g0495181 [Helianthus annuus]
MPVVTSSQSSMLLPPIPPPFQKNVDNAQKKTSCDNSYFQNLSLYVDVTCLNNMYLRDTWF